MNDCDENEWCRSQPPCQKIIKCRYVDRKMEVCSGVNFFNTLYNK